MRIVHTTVHMDKTNPKEMLVPSIASGNQRTFAKGNVFILIYKLIYFSPRSKLTLFLYFSFFIRYRQKTTEIVAVQVVDTVYIGLTLLVLQTPSFPRINNCPIHGS